MIAMQYSFPLPADYDMAIIRRRIAEKGPMTDRFPNLLFKAYLVADKGTSRTAENLYAPFYVWQDSTGLNDFVCGDGFAGVSQAFGWPSVKMWSVWQAEVARGVAQAKFATRETVAIPAHAALAELRRRESEAAVADVARDGALASVVGFEPTTWTHVRFRLWREPREVDAGDGVVAYEVGHMSLPGAV
jgi:hypothetical protein